MVNDATVNRQVLLLALPEYIVTALHDRGVSESKIAEAADFCMDIMYRDDRDKIRTDHSLILEPLHTLFKQLSKQDLKDIEYVNEELQEVFGLTDNALYACRNNGDNKGVEDIISVLSEPKSDLARIVMSNLYSNVYIPWRFVRGSSSVIIVLEKGFFNYKVESIPQFDVYFLNILTSYMFNSFGFDRTIRQEFFKVFNKRVHNLVTTRKL